MFNIPQRLLWNQKLFALHIIYFRLASTVSKQRRLRNELTFKVNKNFCAVRTDFLKEKEIRVLCSTTRVDLERAMTWVWKWPEIARVRKVESIGMS